MKFFGIIGTGLLLGGVTMAAVPTTLKTTSCSESKVAKTTPAGTTVFKTVATTISTSAAQTTSNSAASGVQCPPYVKDTWVNGNFECDSLGWRLFSDGIHGTKIEIPHDKGSAHDGERFIQVTQVWGTDGNPLEQASLRQTVKLAPNKSYKITFWTQQAGPAEYINLFVNSLPIRTALAKAGGVWVKNEGTFVAPAALSTFIEFKFLVNGKGAIQRLDSVSLEPIN